MHGFYGGKFPPAWQAPPLANHFRKLPSVWPEISMGSQLVVIGNKYEREYKHAPFDAWQVIRDEKDLGDYEALQQRFGENPRFQIMQNLQKRWPGLSFNDVQFRMLARSACFVSVQGGGCTLQSYFGGTHLVYFREGHEFEIGAYERIYPRLSGVKLTVVTSYKGLERKVHGMIKSNNCFAQLQ
ncbi:unnamed protein product [Closterium sp. Naga37s-1]|nr:unnamed protein product [Closterium sp. Naga37s-1]